MGSSGFRFSGYRQKQCRFAQVYPGSFAVLPLLLHNSHCLFVILLHCPQQPHSTSCTQHPMPLSLLFLQAECWTPEWCHLSFLRLLFASPLPPILQWCTWRQCRWFSHTLLLFQCIFTFWFCCLLTLWVGQVIPCKIWLCSSVCSGTWTMVNDIFPVSEGRYKDLPATLSIHCNRVHQWTIHLYILHFISPACSALSLSYCFFKGPRNGYTHGVLSVSTSAILACYPLAWLVSVLVLFLTPLFSLMATLFHGLIELTFKDKPRFVGLAISLISVYWGLTLLILGSCFTATE